jgi:hypothetical protein
MIAALRLVTRLTTPVLPPQQQSVLMRTRSQAALKLAPSASLKLRNVSRSLMNGPVLNDYTDVTHRAVIAAFPGVHLTNGEINTLSAIAISDAIDSMKKDLDSMSELGQTESLRLQMAMDRMSKLMSTLSNILKKISDTSQSITQNLK